MKSLPSIKSKIICTYFTIFHHFRSKELSHSAIYQNWKKWDFLIFALPFPYHRPTTSKKFVIFTANKICAKKKLSSVILLCEQQFKRKSSNLIRSVKRVRKIWWQILWSNGFFFFSRCELFILRLNWGEWISMRAQKLNACRQNIYLMSFNSTWKKAKESTLNDF